jgi:hypothetical protein
MMRLSGTGIGNIVTSDVVADKHVSKRGWQWGTAFAERAAILKEERTTVDTFHVGENDVDRRTAAKETSHARLRRACSTLLDPSSTENDGHWVVRGRIVRMPSCSGRNCFSSDVRPASGHHRSGPPPSSSCTSFGLRAATVHKPGVAAQTMMEFFNLEEARVVDSAISAQLTCSCPLCRIHCREGPEANAATCTVATPVMGCGGI